jgi:threonine/homoserine/homoserine lactone efflux protein
MIPLPTLLAFAATCALIEITPGPNMAYLAALSLARGWRAGLAAVAGIALGLSVYGVAASLGVATIIENSTFLYETLRWGGVVYLLWLAFDAWRTAGDMEAASARGEDEASAFRRGLITNLLNPKAGVFYVAVLPEFVTPSLGNIALQTLTLSAIYVTIATVIHTLIVLSASRMRTLLRDPDTVKTVRRVLAAMLVGVAVWLAWSTAR